MSKIEKKCAIIFSGGTDSTCVADLKAKDFDHIYLLTYHERGTNLGAKFYSNIKNLSEHNPGKKFHSFIFPIDSLVAHISYTNYFKNLFKFGFLNLSTPGFSSLSWQMRTIEFALKNSITDISDGVTRDWQHFPGHMDVVINLYKELYKEFGLNYENPVRSWDILDDVQFTEKLLIDYGVNKNYSKNMQDRKTTGQHLFKRGIFSKPNIKGSKIDFFLQHDCYPFVVYNIVAFWMYIPFIGNDEFVRKIERLMRHKLAELEELKNELLERQNSSRINYFFPPSLKEEVFFTKVQD